jgi:21S rRNA (GM2251-2'-O)-methyltransferase
MPDTFDDSNLKSGNEGAPKHPKITKIDTPDFETDSYKDEMIISRKDKSNRSNFGESKNFKKGFGDFGEATERSNRQGRSDKFSKGDESGYGDREYSRKPRDFSGRRDNENDEEFSRKPRRNFDDRNDSRGYKKFDNENGFDRRENRDRDRPTRNRSSDFNSEKGDRSFRGDRDGYRGRSERDGGDRFERGFGDRDRAPRGDRDRSDRGYGDRKERNFGDRSERSYGDRPQRADRPDRGGFGERDKPPRGDRSERVFGDRERPSRADKTERRFDTKSEDKDSLNVSSNKGREFKSENRSLREKDRKESNETFERVSKFDQELSLDSQDVSFQRENKDYKERKPKAPKNLEETSIPELESNTAKNTEATIEMNRLTLALLKNKKESEGNNLKDQQKEEITKREEESFEYRDAKKDYLYGMHSVQAALTYNFRKNLELLIDLNYKENIPDHIQKISELAKNKDVKIKHVSRDRLDKLTGGRPHNGVVLKSDIRDYVYLNNFSFIEKFLTKSEGNLLILLDQIVDPQNFGSVIRSSFFLGADAILLNRKNKPPISSTVCKVSSGASECVDLFAVKSLRPFLKEAADKGWTVITTSIEKEADVQLRLDGAHHVSKSNQAVKELNENVTEEINEKESEVIEAKTTSLNDLKLSNNKNVILILGSEASGITSNLSGLAHYNLFIPPMLTPEETGKHPFTLIDSLNVGVSAGIIINHIKTELKNVNVNTNKI